MSKPSSQNITSSAFKLPEIFKGLKPNIHLLHLSVLRQLNNKRTGTASCKTRAEVRGGGKKPWRQKGTGRARAGSIRSPLWVGGGVTFGPKPRSYEIKLPKKAKNLALAQALVAKEKNIIQIGSLPQIEGYKTKDFVAFLKTFADLQYPVMVVACEKETGFLNVKKSARNVPNVLVCSEKFVGPYELIKTHTIIITKQAFDELLKRISKVVKSEKAV